MNGPPERRPPPRRRRLRTPRRLAAASAAGALLPLTALLAACGGGPGDGSGSADGGASLTVLAASSLTEVFADLEDRYEREHPRVDLRLSFAGSQQLAAQVRQGVPADVLVTADRATMAGVAEHTGDPTLIARNALTIVTPPDNPAAVGSLADLAEPGLRVVLAAPEVPAGRYARRVLDAQGLAVTPASEEPTVRAALGKVRLGEADAGLVYVTDAVAAGDAVHTVPLPPGQNVTAAYPAAVLDGAARPAEARALVAWLAGDRAGRLLRDAGFLAP